MAPVDALSRAPTENGVSEKKILDRLNEIFTLVNERDEVLMY